MGYSQTLLYGDNFQIGSNLVNNFVTTAPGTSYTFGSITLPVDMKIKKVYLDMSIRAIYSTSVNPDNQLKHAGILRATRAGTNYDSLTIPIAALYTKGTLISPGCYLHGIADVKGAFIPGSPCDIFIDNWEADSNGIYLLDCQSIARAIMQ